MRKLIIFLLALVGAFSFTANATYFENKYIDNGSIPPVSLFRELPLNTYILESIILLLMVIPLAPTLKNTNWGNTDYPYSARNPNKVKMK